MKVLLRMSDLDYSNMATSCTIALRAALKGVYIVPGRWLLTQTSQSAAVCQKSLLHVSAAASLCSSNTEPQGSRQSSAGTRTDSRGAAQQEQQEPDYIPRARAKNPMMKIGYAWMIGLPTGIIGFLLAKRQVDKNRLKQLKVRQRMRRSNEGEYERSRYLQHTDVNLGR